MCDFRRSFGLDIGFIDHFNTRIMATLTYSAIANIHILQIMTDVLSLSQPAVSSLVVTQ
jgi:hypothetical protein